MYIKQNEYDVLVSYKTKFDSKLDEELRTRNDQISTLQKELETVKKSKKPDHIVIDIYGQMADRGYWKKYREVQFSKCELDLSHGVIGQILRIFREVLKNLNKHYDCNLEQLDREQKAVISKYKIVESNFKKLPFITTRKRVLETLYKELKKEQNG
jgi:uncharacterized HAD superfamily protein